MKSLIKLLSTFIVILLIIGFSRVYSKYNKDLDKKLKKLNYINEKISYFKYKNIDRYLKFYEDNNNLDIKDVIIRVNLDLDKKDYTNIYETKLYNTNKILVNKHIYMNNDYIPNNLVKLNKKYARDNMMLEKNAKNSLERLINDAKSNNLNIRVISSYRSYKYQSNLYKNYVDKDGKSLADTYSARPGFSEHQTGLSIDVDNYKLDYNNFEKTGEYNWMINNSYKYGYILRYPKDREDITRFQFESWHYRYVGKKIAKYIKKHNITFDEYYAMFLNN